MLWYALLWPFARVFHSVTTLQVLEWFIATATAALVLFKAPFTLARQNGEKLEVALQWTESTDETIRSYVNGIRTSAGLGTILGLSEIGVFLVLAIFLVVHAGSHNTLSVFTTKYTPPGFRGISGVIGGSVYTILAFGGFEGAAPLAEEARNPRRTIPRAIMLATLLIGALYVFTTYAVDVAYGPARFTSFTTGTGAASWVGLARSLYGIF